jgi:arylsulfate sulfotransferase
MSASRKLCVFACILVIVISAAVLNGCASALSGSSSVQITPSSAILLPGQKLQFAAVTDASNASSFLWQVNGVVGGSAATGTITTSGVYTAPSAPNSQLIQIGIRSQTAASSVSIYDPSHPTPGTVIPTQNPLVAAYTILIPMGASVQVQFGTNTSYGLSTSTVTSPFGETETIYVAGMRASTAYHMQALINMVGGTQVTDTDHTFMTGAIPASALPNITTQLTGAGTPSDGVELLSLVPNATSVNQLAALATDLAGNVIWYYALPSGAYPEPIKLLPNGHMLLVTQGPLDDVREIDLAGNIIHDITLNQVNQSLAELGSFQILEFTHDVLPLPNGHLILLASLAIIANNVPGIANGNSIAGNALIDWDTQAAKAVWAWSTFDHMSFSHAPYGLSDWTHANAVIYSPDDGNIILSLRNQNWVLKINYKDGTGDGSILWRLGPGGDFTLANGQAPMDWNYGQHYPSIQSPNSSGIFSLMFFDNGNNRLMDSNNDVCGSTGIPACYSSVPILELNEYTMTANVWWQYMLNPAYSTCCGDALVLPNGNVEFDVAMDVNTPNVSYIEEVTQTQSPDLIWRMNVQNQLAYRGIRIPSLYPGQVWPANAQQNLRTPNIK